MYKLLPRASLLELRCASELKEAPGIAIQMVAIPRLLWSVGAMYLAGVDLRFLRVRSVYVLCEVGVFYVFMEHRNAGICDNVGDPGGGSSA